MAFLGLISCTWTRSKNVHEHTDCKSNGARGAIGTRRVASRGVAAGATAQGPRMVQRDWTRRHRAGRLDRQRRIPAWTSSVREVRTLVALGRRRRCGAADVTQPRADALYDGDGRADHDRPPPRPRKNGKA